MLPASLAVNVISCILIWAPKGIERCKPQQALSVSEPECTLLAKVIVYIASPPSYQNMVFTRQVLCGLSGNWAHKQVKPPWHEGSCHFLPDDEWNGEKCSLLVRTGRSSGVRILCFWFFFSSSCKQLHPQLYILTEFSPYEVILLCSSFDYFFNFFVKVLFVIHRWTSAGKPTNLVRHRVCM